MKKDKIIFLDIDGVLNSLESMVRIGKEWYNDMPDREHLKHLDRICKETGAKVVISSTWRVGCSRTLMWMYLFYALGFEIHVESVTPRLPGEYRGEEIKAWIDKRNSDCELDYGRSFDYNPVGNFVILDDDSDMEPFMDRLVQTSFETGLQSEHADKAIEMLNKE